MVIIEMAIYGSRGQRAWFFAFIYMWIRDVCRKSIHVKLFIHAIGLISMIIGLFLLVTTLPSLLSIFGVIIALCGLVTFFTPLGLE